MHDRASSFVVLVLLVALVFALNAPTRDGRIQILLAVIVLGIFWATVERISR